MKVIGVLVVVGAVALGGLYLSGNLDGSVDVQVTDQGKAHINQGLESVREGVNSGLDTAQDKVTDGLESLKVTAPVTD